MLTVDALKRAVLPGLLLVVGAFYYVLWTNAPVIRDDSYLYMVVAQDLQDGRLDSLHGRTIGYPLLLLSTGSANSPSKALFIVQLLLHLASIYLAALMLAKWSVTAFLRWSLIILLLLPLFMERAAFVLTETFAQFLLVAAVYCLSKSGKRYSPLWFGVSGFLIAFSGLVRPSLQLCGAVIAILFLVLAWCNRADRIVRKQYLYGIALYTLAWFIIIGGMIAFNQRYFHYAGLTPFFGFNLSTKTTRVLEKLPDKYRDVREVLIKQRDAQLVKRNSSHRGLVYIFENDSMQELQKLTGMTQAELSRFLAHLSLTLIKANPMEYFTEVMFAFSTYWFPKSTVLANSNSRLLQFFWNALHFLWVGLFFIQAILLTGFFIFVRYFQLPWTATPFSVKNRQSEFNTLIAAILIVVVNLVMSVALQVGDPRHRTATDILILLITAVGLDFLWRLRSKRLKKFESAEPQTV